MRTDRLHPRVAGRNASRPGSSLLCCSRCSRWPLPRRSRSWGRSAARSPTPRAASCRRRGPDHRRGDRRPPHRRDRRRGPLRGARTCGPARTASRSSPRTSRSSSRRTSSCARRPSRWSTSGSNSAALNETVTVSADAQERSSSREPGRRPRARRAAAARPAAQQPRHPVVPAAEPERGRRNDDDIQFLGGRTYGVSYIQDGQASTNAIFGTVGNSAPGLDADLGDPGPLELVQRRVRRPRRRRRHHQARRQRATTARLLRLQRNELNALTYNQSSPRPGDRAGRDDPLSDTHEHRWGGALGGPLRHNKLFFYANYEGSNDKTHLRRQPCHGADRGDAQRRLLGGQLHASGIRSPASRFPASDPGGPHRSVGAEDHGFLLPAPEPATDSNGATGLPAVRAGDAQPAARRPPARLRAEQRTTRCSCAAATSTATRAASSSRRATRSRTCRSSTRGSTRRP